MRTRTAVIAALSAAAVGLTAGCPNGSKPADPAPKNGGGTQTINIDGENVQLNPDREETVEERVVTTVEEMQEALRRIVLAEQSPRSGHNIVLFRLDLGLQRGYVQFEAERQGTPHLRGEAAANEYIKDPANHVSDAGIAELLARGWKMPSGWVTNFHREWPTPDDPAVQKAAAEEAMTVLRETYGLAEGDPIYMALSLEK